MDKRYDVIIVGCGPTGISCAIELEKVGLSYIIIEKGTIVNSIYNFPRNMTFFSTSQKLEIGNIPFISHLDKPTRNEALEYYRRLIFHFDLNINTNEKVLSVEGEDGRFEIITSKSTYRCRKVIVATGFYDNPNNLSVPGEELPKVRHYYNEVHEYIRKRVVVIGGANSACDVALECWQKGAEVTMIVRESELYKGVKYWILPNINNRIKEGSIKAYFNSEVLSISDGNVEVRTPNKIINIDNDYVLAMTGYHPNYEFLESMGIEILKDGGKTPKHNQKLESNRKGLYLAGVIISGVYTSKLFIENTRHHGKIIIEDIIKE